LLIVLFALVAVAEPAAGATPENVVPGDAAADTLGLVVVLRPIAPDDVTKMAIARITGELSAAGFRVLLQPLGPGAEPSCEVSVT
jgi:mRNA-degrading endonuclease toxin of MazEF toxin-antitoxin module